MLRDATSIVARLAPAFVISFLTYAVIWTLLLFKWVHGLIRAFAQVTLPLFLEDLLIAILAVGFYAMGLFIAYNLAVLTNRAVLKYIIKSRPVDTIHPVKPQSEQGAHHRLASVNSIGIVLAGGGAKGAFQAGAMKAIYQFLAEGNALDKVTAISATSIGSWNALFWLANLIKSKDGWQKQGHMSSGGEVSDFAPWSRHRGMPRACAMPSSRPHRGSKILMRFSARRAFARRY